jgi:hypothetical protein
MSNFIKKVWNTRNLLALSAVFLSSMVHAQQLQGRPDIDPQANAKNKPAPEAKQRPAPQATQKPVPKAQANTAWKPVPEAR